MGISKLYIFFYRGIPFSIKLLNPLDMIKNKREGGTIFVFIDNSIQS